VKCVENELDVSQRRACKVVEQPRSTQRYVEHGDAKDREIVKRLQAFAAASALWLSIHDGVAETRRDENQSQAGTAAVARSGLRV